jgi:predicted enzyme related to lactoylglutathione lyase
MSVNLYAVTVDCSDAARLASFWAGVLGRTVDDGGTGEFAAIGLQDPAETGARWMFVKVPEGKTVKNRMHPDLVTSDLPAEAKRILGLGAAKTAEYDDGGTQWITFLDPEGNEFDVMAEGA